ISLDVLNKKLKPADICEETISRHLSTSEFKDPDLLIRSGGELRISNFLLWQIAYSEIFVTDTLWPEFKTKNLLEAIKDFQKRERRFGLVSEQLSEKTKMSNNVSTHSKKLHKV
ncbi:MAG: undecaprenyl diphosphate synthase family protein, partial [Ignavibacteria bacterium]|nr:undecaprenyl diphosphate synthase family protein [Ignavibacteria bacterium]